MKVDNQHLIIVILYYLGLDLLLNTVDLITLHMRYLILNQDQLQFSGPVYFDLVAQSRSHMHRNYWPNRKMSLAPEHMPATLLSPLHLQCFAVATGGRCTN